jgi:Flp pilus assembly pilin Flp
MRTIPKVVGLLQGRAAVGNLIRNFLSADSAAVAMEYAMLGVVIAVAIIASMSNYAAKLNSLFAYVSNYV